MQIFDFFSDRAQLVSDLKNGYVRTVAPGGGDEALFSENYE